ncbi:MAG TPA: flagellar basal body-associated FliL family protein [Deltaproteobacteria bacterium]|nr:flagellar basal body-associated FliL family protein [Deltaproteobacteria bacterium]
MAAQAAAGSANGKEGEEKEKKGGGKMLMIIAAAAVVLGGGGFFVYTSFLSGSDGAHEGAGGDHGGAAVSEGGEHGGGHDGGGASGNVYDMRPFIVNLMDNAGTRYLKVDVSIELASPEQEAELKKLLPQIRDSIIILLSSKSYDDVGTVEGKFKLRDEIVARVNQHLGGEGVRTVYFTDFVIQ